MKIRSLSGLLDFIEEHLDLKHQAHVERLHLSSLRFENCQTLPLSIIPTSVQEDLYPLSEAFADPRKMMFNELMYSFGSIYSSVQLKDFFPLHIRSNYGIGIMPSIFGAESRIIGDNMPWVEPIGLDRAKQLLNEGIPDVNRGLAGRAIETNHFYMETLDGYPKCAKAIHVTQPDMQGVFDIAHLLLGTEIFYLLYDEPDSVKDFLSLITECYIRYRKALTPYLRDQIEDDFICIHGGIYPGSVLLKEDTAMINLSPSLYEEFVLPYNKRIFQELPSSVHYCGGIQQWHYEVLDEQGTMGVNYGNPEMQELSAVYSENYKHRRPIVGWGGNQEFTFQKAIYQNGITTGITLSCIVRDLNEGKQVIEQYKKTKQG